MSAILVWSAFGSGAPATAATPIEGARDDQSSGVAPSPVKVDSSQTIFDPLWTTPEGPPRETIPQKTSPDNLVPEPGFETSSGWTAQTWTDWPASAIWRGTWGTSAPHTGQFAYSLSNLAFGRWESGSLPVTGATEYRLSTWLRGGHDGAEDFRGAMVKVMFLDSAGVLLSSANPIVEFGDLPANWAEVSGVFTTPSGCTAVKIRLIFTQAAGWVAFDDVALAPTDLEMSPVTVPDAGFEAGTGWTPEVTPPYDATKLWRGTWGPGAPHSGSYAAVITNHAFGTLRSARFTLSQNSDYRVEFDLRGGFETSDSVKGIKVFADIYNGGTKVATEVLYEDFTGAVTETWARQSMLIPAPGVAGLEVELAFQFFCSNGWMAVDEVFVGEDGGTTNLVADPGFELGTGWSAEMTWAATSLWRGTFGIATPSAGQYAFAISNQPRSALTSDPIAVDEEANYDLSAWFRGEFDSDHTVSSPRIRATYRNTSGDTISTDVFEIPHGDLTESWSRHDFQLTTPSGCASLVLEIRSEHNSGWVAVDDVELVPGPPVVEFATPTVTVDESDGAAELTLTISRAPDADVTVNLDPTFDTATAADIGSMAQQITWLTGDAAPKTLQIPIVDDEIDELDEALTISISSVTGATVGATPAASVTIQDDDIPEISYSQVRWVGREGNDAVVEFQIPQPPAQQVVLDVTSLDGTAVNGVDYQFSATQVVWSAGDGSPKTVPVAAVADQQTEDPENLWISAAADGIAAAIDHDTSEVIVTDPVDSAVGLKAEAGFIPVPGEGQLVPFIQDFDTTPVVLYEIPGDRGFICEAITSESLESTGSSGFFVRWGGVVRDCSSGTSYLAIEPGVYALGGGGTVFVGTVDTSAVKRDPAVGPSDAWDQVSLPPGLFDASPVVLAQVQTSNNAPNGAPLTTKVAVNAISTSGFDVALERMSYDDGDITLDETIGFVAFSPGVFDGAGIGFEAIARSEYLQGELGCDPSQALPAHGVDSLRFASVSSRNSDSGSFVDICRSDSGGNDMSVGLATAGQGQWDIPKQPESYSLVEFFQPFYHHEQPPTVTLGIQGSQLLTAQILEAGADTSVELELTLDKPWHEPIVVELAITGTAQADDYNLIPDTTTITIPAYAQSATLTVQAVDDTIDDPDGETVIVAIDSVSPGTADSAAVTVSIADDDNPTVSLSARIVAVDEDSGSATLSVALSGEPADPVTVSAATSDGTAGSSTDYVPVLTDLTWVPGDSLEQTIPVGIVSDDDLEGGETFSITLTPSAGASIGEISESTVIIRDAEAAAQDGWRFEAQAPWFVGIGYRQSTIPFLQEYPPPPDQDQPPVLVFPTIWEDPGPHPAAVRVDKVTRGSFDARIVWSDTAALKIQHNIGYVALAPGLYVLPDGTLLEAGYRKLSATTTDDPINWDTVSFVAPFAEPPLLLTQVQTIENWDGDPADDVPVWLTVAADSLTKDGVNLALERSYEGGTVDPAKPETIAYLAISARGDGTFPTSATALSECPFVSLVSDAVVMSACSEDLQFSTNNQSLFGLVSQSSRLGAEEGGWARLCTYGPLVRSVLIENSDPAVDPSTAQRVSLLTFEFPFDTVIPYPDPPIVSLDTTSTAASISESASEQTTFEIILDRPWHQPIEVTLHATGDASIEADYAVEGSTPGSVVVDPVEETVVATIHPYAESLLLVLEAIEDDDSGEGTEAAVLTISGVTIAGEPVDDYSPDSVTVMIEDTLPTATFDASTVVVNEGAGIAEFSVSISRAPSEAASVQITPSFDTADVDDVGVIPTTISWGSDDGTPQIVSIPIVDDDLDELDEVLGLTLTSPSGVALGATNTASLTIVDNDIPVISPGKVRFVGREGETAIITYEIDRIPAESVVAAVGAVDGSAVSGTDFDYSAQSVEWHPGGDGGPRTVAVALTADGIAEMPEDFEVTATVASGSASIQRDSTQVVITDPLTGAGGLVIESGLVANPSLLFGGNGTVPFVGAFTLPPVVLLRTFDDGGVPRMHCGNRLIDVTQSGFSVVESILPFSCWGATQFLAVEPGVHVLSGTGQIVADTAQTSSVVRSASIGDSGSWTTYWFAIPFAEAPSILARVQSANNLDTSTVFEYPMNASVAIRNVTNTGFEYAIERGAAPNDGVNVNFDGVLEYPETIGFIAVSHGTFDLLGVEVDSQFMGEVVPYSSWTCDPSMAFDLPSGFAFAGQTSRNGDSGVIAEVCRYLPSDNPMRVSVHAPFGAIRAPTGNEGYSLVRFSDDILHISPVPIVSVEAAGTLSVDEAQPALEQSFGVTLDKPWLTEVEVTFEVTAEDGIEDVIFLDEADAVLDLSNPILIPPGETEFTIRVRPNDDHEIEGNETVTVAVVSVVDGDGRDLTVDDAHDSVDIEILDDDLAVVSIGPQPTTVDEPDAGSTATVGLTVSTVGEPAATATVGWETVADTATGDQDFVSASGEIDFSPAKAEGPIEITINGDDYDEGSSETFKVRLVNPVGLVLGTNEVEIEVLDDDVAGIAGIPASVDLDEDGDPGTEDLQVVLTSEPTASVTITFTNPDVDQVTITPSSLTIQPDEWNATTHVVDIAAVDDSVADGTYTGAITISVSSEDQVYSTLAPDPIELTVDDDDQAGLLATVDGVEGAPLTLDEGTTSDLAALALKSQPVDVVTVALSASSADIELKDLQGDDLSSLQFDDSNWDEPQTIRVVSLDDATYSADLDFTIDASTGSHPNDPPYSDLGALTVFSGTVFEAEQPGIDGLESPVEVQEGGPGVELSLSLHTPPSDVVEISLTGSDPDQFTVQPDTVSFAPADWNSAEGITINPVDDSSPDGTFLGQVSIEVASSDPEYDALDQTISVVVADNESMAVISRPLNEQIFNDDDDVDIVLSDSVAYPGHVGRLVVYTHQVPDYEVVLDQQVGFPIATDPAASFPFSSSKSWYRVRFFVGTQVEIANLDPLSDPLPCSGAQASADCVAAEVVVRETTLYQVALTGFQVAPAPDSLTGEYLFPETIGLIWDGDFGLSAISPQAFQRSSDGGASWDPLPEAVDQTGLIGVDSVSSFRDTGVVPGETYHYRIASNSAPGAWVYLGSTLESPGLPVTTPIWVAPRPVPYIDAIEWHCPAAASKFACNGTATIRLEPEPDETLEGTVIRVFVNEPTFDMPDGEGDSNMLIWPADESGLGPPVVRRDEPACFVRREILNPETDREIQGADGVQFEIPVVYGSNGVRFEIDADGDGVADAERAILLGMHGQLGENVVYPEFLPLLFGDRVKTPQFTVRGLGPASRRSPDCGDLDQRALYTTGCTQNSPRVFPSYWAELTMDEYGVYPDPISMVATDPFGHWPNEATAEPSQLNDGVLTNPQIGPQYSCGGAGYIGRRIAGVAGQPLGEPYLAQRVQMSDDNDNYRPIYYDASLPQSPQPPQITYSDDIVSNHSMDPIVTFGIKFRIQDFDHDVNPNEVWIHNDSIADSEDVAAFYRTGQRDNTNGHWGWFVAEVPMVAGPNQLRICTWDQQGLGLGPQGATECASVTVTRKAPKVRAVITSPGPGTPVGAGIGEIIDLDGTASVGPPGAVGVWTVGRERNDGTWAAKRTTDANGLSIPDLATSFAYQHYNAIWARLVVATSAENLPDDLWPDDGQLPCVATDPLGSGECDSVQVEIDRLCPIWPANGSISISQPSGSQITVGPEETVDLVADWEYPDSTGPNHPSFRWVVLDGEVYSTAIGWIVTTLGVLGPSGDGFSPANEAIDYFKPTEQGLSAGRYTLMRYYQKLWMRSMRRAAYPSA